MLQSRFIIGRLLPNPKFAICCLATGRRRVAWCCRDGQHVFRVLLVFKASWTRKWSHRQVDSAKSMESSQVLILPRSRVSQLRHPVEVQKCPKGAKCGMKEARCETGWMLSSPRPPPFFTSAPVASLAFPKSTSACEEDREGEIITEMLSMLEKAAEWRKGRRRGR